MKRYTVKGWDNDQITYEDSEGDWVDADIAQSLYSALKESRAVVQGLIYEGYMGYLPLRSKIDVALEKADKE